MPEDPLVTIVTPSFNQASFLEQAVRSVLAQDYAPMEYILVDGGSQDGSRAIIEKYAGHFAWWVSEADRGQAHAIRKGFSRAKGQILAWLNSDDLLAPGAIRTAARALQAEPGLGLVYGNAASIDEKGRPLNDMRFRQFRLEDLAAFEIICQPAVFMRREAYLEAGGIDEGYHFLLDHHLWLRIASQWEIRHLDQTLAFARRHAGAKNVALGEQFGREGYRVADWLLQGTAFQGANDVQKRRIRAAALRFDARYLMDTGAYGRAFAGYLRALRTHAGTALKEWQRILFSLLGMLGLGKLGALYYRAKHRRGLQFMPGLENVSELYPAPHSEKS